MGDGAPGGPQEGEDGETGDTAESEFRVGKSTQVISWDGGDELITKGFVGFLKSAEDGLVIVEEAVYFRDLWAGGGRGVLRLRGAVNGSDEWDAARSKEVGSGGQSEGEVAVDAIARIGRNGGGVTVELGLGEADGGVGWRGCERGDGSEDGDWKRGGDRSSGEAGGFLHGG